MAKFFTINRIHRKTIFGEHQTDYEVLKPGELSIFTKMAIAALILFFIIDNAVAFSIGLGIYLILFLFLRFILEIPSRFILWLTVLAGGGFVIVWFSINWFMLVSSGGSRGFGQKVATPQEQQATAEWLEQERIKTDKQLKERYGMTIEEYRAKWKK